MEKISYVKRALSVIGINSKSSELTDSNISALMYTFDSVYNAMINITDWNCFKKDDVLNRLVDGPVNPRYQYQYTLPADCIKVMKVYLGASRTKTDTDFEYYDGKLLSNRDELTIQYKSKYDSEYLPHYMESLLIYQLANDNVTLVTQNQQTRNNIAARYERELALAIRSDFGSNPSWTQESYLENIRDCYGQNYTE